MDNKHFDSRTPNPETFNWEFFWNINEPSIKAELVAKMQPYFNLFSAASYPEDKRQDNLDKKINAEKEFVKLLLPKLKELLDKNAKVLMLVDIDEAVAGHYEDRSEQTHTIIRPAFIKILELLEPYKAIGKIETGLLTSRGVLNEQLNDPKDLAIIKTYLNLNYLYTTKDYQSYNNTVKELKALATKENGILKSELTEDDYQTMSDIGSIEKVRTLENIKQQITDFTTLVVDDFPYTNYLNQKNNLHGVHIKPNAMFFVD